MGEGDCWAYLGPFSLGERVWESLSFLVLQALLHGLGLVVAMVQVVEPVWMGISSFLLCHTFHPKVW